VRRVQFGHRHLQLRQGAQGITQARQVTGPCIAQTDPCQDTFDIADFFQLRLQLFKAIAVEQASNRRLACLQHGQVPQRTVQPTGQQTAAHGGLATVYHRLQGVIAATGQVGVQFQVATAGAIKHHGIVQTLMAQAAQVRQGGTLGFLGVAEQAAGSADSQGQGFATKAFKVLHRELLAQTFQCRITFKIPRCTTFGSPTLLGGQVLGPIIRDQQLHRIDTLQLRQQVFPTLDLQHAEVAAGDIQHRQAEQTLIAQHRRNQVIATLIQQRLITHRAWGDDAHHLALHRPFAGGRVTDLLTDHHRLAQLDQLDQVAFQRVIRNPTHRNRLPRRLPARGQGDVQQLGGLLRVFVEDLVEVAHAIEHQLIRVLVFQAPVLLHHRGVAGQIRNCFIHQWLTRKWSKGWGKFGA